MPRFNQKGQSLTEYMILMVLVSLAAVGLTQSLGKSIKKTIRKARDRIDKEIVFKERK